MHDFIMADFGVEKFAQSPELTIYGAVRRDVWHLIYATQRAGEGHGMQILQRHIPRYSMARAVLSVHDKAESGRVPADSVVMTKESALGGIARFPNGKLGMVHGNAILHLSESVEQSVATDVPILVEARAEVHQTGDKYVLPKAKTHTGNPVESTSRTMIEAIGFERRIRKNLTATDFALYSAFCTWRDFLVNEPNKARDITSGIGHELTSMNTEEIGNSEYWESVLGIEDEIFGTRIWGPGIQVSAKEFADKFFSVLGKLSSIGFAQFVLLNGMQVGGPFHPIALLLGLMDWDEFNYWRTQSFQPDSDEEQEIRTQNASIQLLGLLENA